MYHRIASFLVALVFTLTRTGTSALSEETQIDTVTIAVANGQLFLFQYDLTPTGYRIHVDQFQPALNTFTTVLEGDWIPFSSNDGLQYALFEDTVYTFDSNGQTTKITTIADIAENVTELGGGYVAGNSLYLGVSFPGGHRPNGIYRYDLSTGQGAYFMNYGAFRAMTLAEDERLLVLQPSPNDPNEYSIIAYDSYGQSLGTVTTIPTTDCAGLACDMTTGALYWVEGTSLIRFQDGERQKIGNLPYSANDAGRAGFIRGYYCTRFPNLTYHLQSMRALERHQDALTIWGTENMTHGIDAAFSLSTGIVIDRPNFTHYCVEEAYTAVQTGEQVDLFYLPLSAGVRVMMKRGFAAPLEDETLLNDVTRFYPAIAETLTYDSQLYAVLNRTRIGGWHQHSALTDDLDVPATWAEVLDLLESWPEHPLNTGVPLIMTPLFPDTNTGWSGNDYVDAIITAFVREQLRSGQEVDFSDETFITLMERLRGIVERKIIDATQREKSSETEYAFQAAWGSGESPYYSVDVSGISVGFFNATIAAAPTVFADSPGALSVDSMVYILNPRAPHKEQAMTYLRYVAQNREKSSGALYCADAVPAHVFAEDILYYQTHIAELQAQKKAATSEAVKEQLDREIGYDEINLKNLTGGVDSWTVYEPLLTLYRTEVVPAIYAEPSALLDTAFTTHTVILDELLALGHRYLSGGMPIDQCVRRMNEIVNAMLMEQ